MNRRTTALATQVAAGHIPLDAVSAPLVAKAMQHEYRRRFGKGKR